MKNAGVRLTGRTKREPDDETPDPSVQAGTRSARDSVPRGQGHYRALTEQQEEWALANGYQELVVKTKNKFYTMRATLDHLRFNVVRFQQVPADNGESKVYLSKLIGAELLRHHQTERTLVESV